MTSPPRTPPPQGDDRDGRPLAESERARREREARALRENLMRRKAQARARRDGSGTGGDPQGGSGA